MDEESAELVIGGSFASVAEDYVAAIGGAAAGRDLDQLETAQFLVGLVAAALDVPFVEASSAALLPRVDTLDVTWPAGFPDVYLDVFHPLAVAIRFVWIPISGVRASATDSVGSCA